MKHIQSPNSRSTLTNVEQKDIQPNAVDLRVSKFFRVSTKDFVISEDQKTHRGSKEIEPDIDGWFYLQPGHYEVIMENTINVGDNEAGWVITRSTLNRNGLFLTSGLYDSGYKGVMAGALHVNCGGAYIVPGTRLGQFILFKAESLNQYDGSYGTGKEHDKKYEEK